MNDRGFPFDSGWDDGVYGTGSTQPPKSHRALLALLLVIIIFLGGIATALSILNIRLFHELHQREDALTVAYAVQSQTEAEAEVDPTLAETYPREKTTVDLQQTPDGDSREGEMSLQEIYETNIPAVVSISASTGSGSSTGTGVVLSANGYLLTNYHVIRQALAINVTLTDERELRATLVGEDPVSDLAVLRVDAEDLTPAQFGDSDGVRVGDSVVAIGDPLGVELRGTMTDGIVSAISRDVQVDGRVMNLIQTNAALNSGNSGGPLINRFGQVIGINTMKIGTFADSSGVEGLGFAIPSAVVEDIVGQIISQGYVSGRPWLGISGESLSLFYQHYYRLPAGLYISEVAENSSAADAGIAQGDILISVDGTNVYTQSDLDTLLYGYTAGDQVTLIIYRSGYTMQATITLEEAKNAA